MPDRWLLQALDPKHVLGHLDAGMSRVDSQVFNQRQCRVPTDDWHTRYPSDSVLIASVCSLRTGAPKVRLRKVRV